METKNLNGSFSLIPGIYTDKCRRTDLRTEQIFISYQNNSRVSQNAPKQYDQTCFQSLFDVIFNVIKDPCDFHNLLILLYGADEQKFEIISMVTKERGNIFQAISFCFIA